MINTAQRYASAVYAWPYVNLYVPKSVLPRGGSRSRDWRGPYGERGARAYNGGLGAVPPAGSRGRAPGQGVRGGEAPLKLNACWCCHMSEMALNCYVYELFMVINGCCSTNMCARQLSFSFSSMVWGPPFGSAPERWW